MSSSVPRTGLPPAQNVLLVHCDKMEMDRFVRYLDGSYQLFPVATERQVLSILEDRGIQVIIINAGPGCLRSAMQLCSRLRSMPRYAHLIILLVIAADNMEARIGCLEAGADAWMELPLSGDYLRAQLKNLLANRRRLKTCFGQNALLNQHPVPSTPANLSFQNRLGKIIADHLADPGLNVDVLARLMNISRPTLYRKIKAISDRTPNQLVNSIRLNKAAELLSAGDYKVLDIARLVGFHSRSNFGKAFVKHFNSTPMEYRQRTFGAKK